MCIPHFVSPFILVDTWVAPTFCLLCTDSCVHMIFLTSKHGEIFAWSAMTPSSVICIARCRFNSMCLLKYGLKFTLEKEPVWISFTTENLWEVSPTPSSYLSLHFSIPLSSPTLWDAVLSLFLYLPSPPHTAPWIDLQSMKHLTPPLPPSL